MEEIKSHINLSAKKALDLQPKFNMLCHNRAYAHDNIRSHTQVTTGNEILQADNTHIHRYTPARKYLLIRMISLPMDSDGTSTERRITFTNMYGMLNLHVDNINDGSPGLFISSIQSLKYTIQIRNGVAISMLLKFDKITATVLTGVTWFCQ